MASTTFDALAYFEELKSAGMPESQAKIQAEAMRSQAHAQAEALRVAIKEYDDARQKDLATKGDIAGVRLEIEKVRAEVGKTRAEVDKLRAEVDKFRTEVDSKLATMKYDLLKWQIGIAITLLLVMAKGFNWIGF